jgi:hypothetical protein
VMIAAYVVGSRPMASTRSIDAARYVRRYLVS